MKRLIEETCKLVEVASGNRLGAAQAHMVESRLRRRMAQLGLETPAQYEEHLAKHRGTEISVLISLLTTHHTFFFREFIHYEFIRDNLAGFASAARQRGDKAIRFWSAACSKGQEVYSLAMLLETYLPQVAPDMTYAIRGTDIDEECVKYAANGVYPFQEVKEVPRAMLGWWDRGVGEISDFVRIKKLLREKCSFAVGNLDKVETYPPEKFDAILCRNVLIYFNDQKVRQISMSLRNHLVPGGYLITGVSESLSSHLAALKMTAAAQVSVYQSEELSTRSTSGPVGPVPVLASPKLGAALPTAAKSETRRMVRVVSVDDSPTVLKLLKAILTPETGFEVVGTAENGKLAAKVISEAKPDAVTLDIHMPEMDGLTYLQTHFGKNHPPVIVISSASRLDSEVAMKSMKLGASDFIEKPSLGNIEFRGNEIRTKIRVALWNAARPIANLASSVDSQFSKSMPVVPSSGRARIVLCNMSSWAKLTDFLKALSWSEPPLFLFFEGHKEILGALRKRLAEDCKFSVTEIVDKVPATFEKNMVYVADFRTFYSLVTNQLDNCRTSLMVFGLCSDQAFKEIHPAENLQVLLEDTGSVPNSNLLQVVSDVVPVTSFPYMSTVFLATEVTSDKLKKTGT